MRCRYCFVVVAWSAVVLAGVPSTWAEQSLTFLPSTSAGRDATLADPARSGGPTGADASSGVPATPIALHEFDGLNPDPANEAQPSATPEAEAGNHACAGPDCDCAKMQELAKAAAAAHQGLYYKNKFDYVCDPCYDDCYLGDILKRRRFGDCWVYDVGGEYRMRYHNENNLRGRPLTGNDDDFLLHRTRLYLNAEYSDWIRLYGEAIDATSDGHNLSPRGIEVNRADALNLFADVKLWNGYSHDGAMWLRAGRQEMLFGAQRFISPLDWSNTRRTFDGFDAYWRGAEWDVDAFWTRPVGFAQHLPRDHNFDNPDQSQEFHGLYASYKGQPDRTTDFYYLRLAEYDPTVRGGNQLAGGFDVNTLGTRMQGKSCCWLWEAEAGYQFGDYADDDINAGYFTLGAGHVWEHLCWKPTLWAYYDWASGDSDPADGDHGTANQLFPLGHKYLGFMDIIARQNIQDVNALLTVAPTDKVTLLMWWHAFYLQQERDALYNAGGAPIYHDPTGVAGNDVGQEVDLMMQWKFATRADVVFGYSHFFAGDYFDSPTIQGAAAGLGANGSNGADADFFYTQMSVRF